MPIISIIFTYTNFITYCDWHSLGFVRVGSVIGENKMADEEFIKTVRKLNIMSLTSPFIKHRGAEDVKENISVYRSRE